MRSPKFSITFPLRVDPPKPTTPGPSIATPTPALCPVLAPCSDLARCHTSRQPTPRPTPSSPPIAAPRPYPFPTNSDLHRQIQKSAKHITCRQNPRAPPRQSGIPLPAPTPTIRQPPPRGSPGPPHPAIGGSPPPSPSAASADRSPAQNTPPYSTGSHRPVRSQQSPVPGKPPDPSG